MKKLCALFLVVMIMPTLLVAKAPRIHKTKTKQFRSVSEQVNAYLSYPEVLRKGSHEGIVVIQFSLNEENRLSQLKVHSGNEELNTDLIRQLTGRKLFIADSTPFDTHTVRLHFQNSRTR